MFKTPMFCVHHQPEEVADRFKELFDNGLGLVTLSFIDMDDVPVFAEDVISQFR